MPDTAPELAYWVMTGVIAGLLSLITVMVAIIGYLLKSGFDKLMARIDSMQTIEQSTAQLLGETRSACEERHLRIDRDLSELKTTVYRRRQGDTELVA